MYVFKAYTLRKAAAVGDGGATTLGLGGLSLAASDANAVEGMNLAPKRIAASVDQIPDPVVTPAGSAV